MYSSPKKAQDLARDLITRLQFRGFTITYSQDVNGFPILTTGQGIVISINAFPMVSADVFNNPLFAYTPHFATITYASASAPTVLNLVLAELEIAKTGIAQVLTDSTTSTSTSFDFDLQWPTKGM